MKSSLQALESTEQLGLAPALLLNQVPKTQTFSKMPRHVGLIPDGNRRWARERGMHPAEGYKAGVYKGLQMLQDCLDLGIEEVSIYGFTQDNTKRPRDQRIAFANACVHFARAAMEYDIALLVVGDASSSMFPDDLKPFAAERQGKGLKVNMLVNYGWEWDLQTALASGSKKPLEGLASRDVSRMDMIVRWGGFRRLSGFLPVQSVYADFYVVDDYWPAYELSQFHAALAWFQTQEPTLGG
jgi:undecaprenyl diphosphate synthase